MDKLQQMVKKVHEEQEQPQPHRLGKANRHMNEWTCQTIAKLSIGVVAGTLSWNLDSERAATRTILL